ncbi:hypothetical protein [Haloarcula argentinensis]|uniref:hypothetical protein n=1 Tax=Haloarcula argentinensis TaxID=43776 RepID=UPI0002B179B4|nr:hypothetical protein [Haloarcula argentinensis]EMA25730.1 hypothetical protein C443_02934 [Haloarcula argentinensis DSM 12282]
MRGATRDCAVATRRRVRYEFGGEAGPNGRVDLLDPDVGEHGKWSVATLASVEFDPRSDGGFERIEAVWNGCQWRVTGREVVTTMRRI